MTDKWMCKYILCSLILSWHSAVLAQFSQQQLDWLESDAEHPAERVNEGELEFFTAPAEKTEHRQSMQISITNETIASGWAVVKQCHENLDAVENLEIVFHKARVKNLRVTKYENVGKVWSEGHRIVIQNILYGSKVCLSAKSWIFHPVKDRGKEAQYEMVNGPFMRRFLDGFYPLNLSLDISYPNQRLQLLNVSPEAQAGWKIRYDAGRVFLAGRFEGRLSTRLQFNLNQ